MTEDEFKWFKKFQEDRASHEEASFKSRVLAKHEYIGEQRKLNSLIIKSYKKGKDMDYITEAYDVDIDYAKSVIENLEETKHD